MYLDKHLYQYRAAVIDVTDGDTLTAMIDLGFGVFLERKVRLYGIDTPELSTNKKAALGSKDRLEELVKGKTVLLIAVKHEDKFGRFLAKCRLLDSIATDVVGLLIAEGHGKEYYGGKKS